MPSRYVPSCRMIDALPPVVVAASGQFPLHASGIGPQRLEKRRMLTFDGWFTLVVLVVMFIGLTREFLGADIVMFFALVCLWTKGIISTDEALSGFNNPQVLTVALLFVVSAGMQQTGGLTAVTRFMLGQHLERKRVLARLLAPTALISGFMNNTPLVAMLTPAVRDWALRNDNAPSKFLIPLSYAAILGGTCTLIGTSTNLVVSGLMQEAGMQPLSMFEMTPVGLTATFIGLLFMMTVGRKLLPDRRSPEQKISENQREYAVTLEVKPDCPLIGQSVERAGLRQLRGLFLVEIERQGQITAPVRPSHRIKAWDRLTFFGVADTVVDLQRIQGLVPVSEDGSAATVSDRERRLFEVVVSSNSPLVGQTLRDANFRRRYDAAVIAVHRGGVRLRSKLGDVKLRAGDTLMLEASPGFRAAWGNQADFYLVAQVEEFERPKFDKAPVALTILVLMVVAMSTGIMSVLMSVAVAALLMVLTGCLRPDKARRSIDLSIVIMIASSFGLSRAVVNSGVADLVATSMIGSFADLAPWVVIASLYLVTAATTEIMSNNAAAALVFPIAISTAEFLERDPRPYAIAVCVAASMSFVTPFGYQTNLMVYGPGGYRFTDFVRIGIPMLLLSFTVAMVVIPLVWGW